MSFSLDDPPHSRLFVVAGRNTSAEFLRSVFEQYGDVAFVKYLRDKGVAYIKYDRASSAALAVENLHEVTLNEGQGPRLKVMLAESPHTRSLPGLHMRRPDEEAPLDPDNTPPRSRLFLVVPKNADGSIIEAEMSRYAGMQYCKTDLVAAKGIVFAKYTTSSAACMAMEGVQHAGSVAGYKVKIMLAEPKTRRVDSGAFMHGLGGDLGGGMHQGGQQPRLAGMPGGFAGGEPSAQLLSSLSPNLVGPNGMALQDFSSLQSAVTSLGGGFASGMQTLGEGSGLRMPGSALDPAALSPQVAFAGAANGNGAGFGGFNPNLGGEYDYSGLSAFGGLGLASPMLGGSGLLGSNGLLGAPPQMPLDHQQQGGEMHASNTRLYIVVHKSATEEALAHIFRCYPGMEYLDLKRDRATGRSKGYAYVKYANPDAAAAAMSQLNGMEYPPGTNCKLKVLPAEPLGGGMPRPRPEDGAAPGAAATAMLGTSRQSSALAGFRLPSHHSGDSLAQDAAYGAGGSQQQQHSARTDFSSSSHDTHLSAHSSPLHLPGGGEGGMGGLLGPPGLDLAAMQQSLAGMSLGLGGDGTGNHAGGLGQLSSPHPSPPVSAGRVSSGLSESNGLGGGPGSWREPSPDQVAPTSAGPSPGRKPAAGQADGTVVYAPLPRPIPDYALASIFAQCGTVEYVRVLPEERVALVKYATPEAAAMAVGSLNGIEVLGEVLHVHHSPRLTPRATALGAP